MDAELQQLKDIHLPHAIHMWPIAPGWIALYILVFILVGYLLYYWFRTKRKKYTIHFALAKLEKLQQDLKNNSEMNVAAEISTLLRRTALYYFPRENIAGLTGKNWLQFLNHSGNTLNFTQEIGVLLTDAPYQKNCLTDAMPLFTLARAWLMAISKKNRVEEK